MHERVDNRKNKLTAQAGNRRRFRNYRNIFVPFSETQDKSAIATMKMSAIEKEQIPTLDELSTVVLPAIDVTQLTTQLDLRAIRVSSLPVPVVKIGKPIGTRGPTRSTLPAEQLSEKASQITSDTVSLQKEAEKGPLAPVLDMLKSSGIYALGAFASPLISLTITPFLTNHLSSNNYGGLAVLYTIIDLVTIITQVGLVGAFFRAYNGDYESPQDRLAVLTTTIILLLLFSLPVALLMMLAASSISVLLFDSPSFSEPVKLTALIIFFENLTVPGISWLRAEKRAGLFSFLSIANLLAGLGTNIVLVGVFHMGVDGALLAKGSGYFVTVACTLPTLCWLLIRKRGLHIRFDIARGMLVFGLPTIFSDMAAWVLQLSDRYLLGHFGTLAQTASYTVAYTLGGALSPLVLAPFGLAWTPMMYTVAKRKDAPHIFQLVFRWFNIVVLFAAFSLSLLSTLLLELLFPPAYRSAEPVIPMIALSTAFIGIWYIFMTGVYLRRKTIYQFFFTLTAAVLNALLNILLIPYFGSIGAAFATLCAYGVLLLVTYIFNQKIYPIPFEVRSFILRVLVGVALYIGCIALSGNQEPPIRWSICLGGLGLYSVFLFLHGGLSVQTLRQLFLFVRKTFIKRGGS